MARWEGLCATPIRNLQSHAKQDMLVEALRCDSQTFEMPNSNGSVNDGV